MMDLFFTQNKVLFLFILIWVMFWKGCALWFAAKEDKRGWFLAILLLNLFGILEIIFIFGVLKKKWSDLRDLLIKPKIQNTEPEIATEETKPE